MGATVAARLTLGPRHAVLLQQLQQRHVIATCVHLSRVSTKRIQPRSLLRSGRSSRGAVVIVVAAGRGIALGAWGTARAPRRPVERRPQAAAQVLHLPLPSQEHKDAAGGQGAVDLGHFLGSRSHVVAQLGAAAEVHGDGELAGRHRDERGRRGEQAGVEHKVVGAARGGVGRCGG